MRARPAPARPVLHIRADQLSSLSRAAPLASFLPSVKSQSVDTPLYRPDDSSPRRYRFAAVQAALAAVQVAHLARIAWFRRLRVVDFALGPLPQARVPPRRIRRARRQPLPREACVRVRAHRSERRASRSRSAASPPRLVVTFQEPSRRLPFKLVSRERRASVALVATLAPANESRVRACSERDPRRRRRRADPARRGWPARSVRARGALARLRSARRRQRIWSCPVEAERSRDQLRIRPFRRAVHRLERIRRLRARRHPYGR